MCEGQSFTVYQAAKQMGISLDRVRLLLQRGELQGYKTEDKGEWRVTHEGIEGFLSRTKRRHAKQE